MKNAKAKVEGAQAVELPLTPASPPVAEGGAEGATAADEVGASSAEAPAQDVPAGESAPAAEEAPATVAAPKTNRAAIRDIPRIMTRIFGTPLLVDATKLEIILGVLGPRLGLSDGSAASEVLPKAIGVFAGDEDGDEDDYTTVPYQVTADGIAIMCVDGTLVYKSSWIGALSGLTGYGDIRSSLDAAVADPAVKGILLCVDSYGGEANGCFDLSDAIFAMRSQKPIYGAAADNSLSGGYALLSACSKVFVSRTSAVGSIGVVSAHIDQSGADKLKGLKYTYVYSGDHKIDGNPHSSLTPDARDSMQAEADRVRMLFASSVGRYRSMSVDAVIATQAAMFFGENGVSAGLADSVGTPDDAYAALLAAVSRPAALPTPITQGMQTAAPEAPPSEETPAPVIEETPAPTAAVEAVKPDAQVIDLAAERQKIKGEAVSNAVEICELCAVAGMPEKAAELVRSGITTDAARQLLQTLRAQSSDARAVTGHITADAGGTDLSAAGRSWGQFHAAARGITGELK